MSCWESEPLLRDSEIDSALWIGPERLNSHLCRKAWRGDGGEISRLSRSTVIVACHRRNLPLKLCGLTRVSHAAAHSEMANEQRSLLSSRSVVAEHMWLQCVCQPHPPSAEMFPSSAGCKAPQKWIRVILCPDRGRGGGRRRRTEDVGGGALCFARQASPGVALLRPQVLWPV